MDTPPLEDRVAQLLFPRIGSNMPPPVTVEEDVERIKTLLDRCPVGGLVLFNGSLKETPELLSELQRASPYPLLISSDIERGVGQQIRGATVFPHAMAFGRVGDDAEEVLEQAARVQAREALACGIHITFAPVADVNRDPRNPIIATRAFGTDPVATSRLVDAYIRGCRAEGLLTTAKHFPGHGNTHVDSHAELPVVPGTREELDRTDLVPFRSAVEAGVDLIMTAHIVCPALDPSGSPATLSRPMLVDLLRCELGFRGAVITDSLLMGAIRATPGGEGEQAVALLLAGVDLLLDVASPEQSRDGILAAVRTNALPEARVNEAYARVRALKERLLQRFGPDFFVDPGKSFAPQEVGSESNRKLAWSVARRAVDVLGAKPGTLPIPAGDMLVVLVKPHRTRLDPPTEPLAEYLQAAFPGVVYHQIGPETDESALGPILEQARTFRHVVVAMVVKPAAWHVFGLLPAQQQFAERLVEQQSVVVASLGTPYILERFPGAAAQICTYSDVAASQSALVNVLKEGN